MVQLVTRYYVEHLPAHENPHDVSQRSKVHAHCREYHWVRVDQDTIVGLAHFRNGTQVAKANQHQTVTVLASLYDRTPVKSMLSPEHYAKMKAKYSLADEHTTSDFVGKLLAAGHSHFEPSI